MHEQYRVHAPRVFDKVTFLSSPPSSHRCPTLSVGVPRRRPAAHDLYRDGRLSFQNLNFVPPASSAFCSETAAFPLRHQISCRRAAAHFRSETAAAFLFRYQISCRRPATLAILPWHPEGEPGAERNFSGWIMRDISGWIMRGISG